MSKEVFKSLEKPVQHRLLRQLPNIVLNDEDDRLARLETHRAALAIASENSATEYREQMERKMEAVRRHHAIQRSEVQPVPVVVPVPAVVDEPSEPMSQAELVELSQQHPDSSKITTRLEALYDAYDSDPDEDDTDEDL